jgi:hypothetical protein
MGDWRNYNQESDPGINHYAKGICCSGVARRHKFSAPSLEVSLIGIKPIIKCVSHQSCEHMETRPSLSGTGKNFVRQEP